MNSYLDELFKLKGKTAVVIGAGGHLCSEMARGFARAGCAVAVLDIKLDKAKAVEDDLRAMGFDRVMSTAIALKSSSTALALSNLISRTATAHPARAKPLAISLHK
jgi:NAD(P)-dependent dehydrogenase (short-subunit alcohol dehydrogenase family)